MARQATGPNKLPNTPTFLQVYKIISVYSLLKPPKTGNCKILEPNIHTITIHDLNSRKNNEDVSQRIEKIVTLKNKLDSLVMNEVEVFDIFNNNIHNYNKADVEDCVLYLFLWLNK